MRTKLLVAAFLLAVTGLLAGCGKSTVNGPAATTTQPSMDQAAVAGVVASEPSLVEDGQYENTDVTSIDGGATGTASAILPLRFWRTISEVRRTFTFAFADTDSTGRPTTAIVTVNKLLTGRFNILAGVPNADTTMLDTAYVVHKPLSDHWVRRILLKRVTVPGGDDTAWRIVATSGVKVTSKDALTRIESLRVQSSAGLDTTITDPLAFQRLRRIPRVSPGDRVTLTVTTLRNDDVVVMMLFGHRFRFHTNGDGTYTGVWFVPDPDLMVPPGPRPAGPPVLHFGVNALSRGTLFDDAAPYDSQAWLLPFLVVPDEIADAVP